MLSLIIGKFLSDLSPFYFADAAAVESIECRDRMMFILVVVVLCYVARKYCRMAHSLSPVDQLVKNLEMARENETFYNEYCTKFFSS